MWGLREIPLRAWLVIYVGIGAAVALAGQMELRLVPWLFGAMAVGGLGVWLFMRILDLMEKGIDRGVDAVDRGVDYAHHAVRTLSWSKTAIVGLPIFAFWCFWIAASDDRRAFDFSPGQWRLLGWTAIAIAAVTYWRRSTRKEPTK